MTDNGAGRLQRFSKLLHPVDADEFVTGYYEQRPLHVRRDNPHYFSDLLTVDDVDRLFQCAAIAKSAIRVAKEGKEIPSDRYSDPFDGAASNDRLLKLFTTGHTIIINGGGRLFPTLDRFCADTERELGFRVQANIYLTPFDAQGFATHYDDHDVFVLQIMGSKNSRLFHAPIELPSDRQPHKSGSYTLQDPEMALTLSPGDSLYVPRGVLHDASTDGVSSAHITFGLYPTYRFDLLQELTYLAQDMPEFRRSVPIGLLRDREAASREFKALLTNLVATLDVDTLVERRYAKFVADRRLDASHRFKDLAALNTVNLDTVVRKRSSVLHRIERDGKSVAVSFSSNRIPIQPFLETALDTLLGDDPFAIRDINGFLTDKARLDLAVEFLKAGFLEIVDEPCVA